jgi:hypothetical protein
MKNEKFHPYGGEQHERWSGIMDTNGVALPDRKNLLWLLDPGYDNKDRIVEVLRAFIDDSGTHDREGRQIRR